MQSNKHKQADPLTSSDDLAKRVGPLSVAQEIFKYDGITVRIGLECTEFFGCACWQEEQIFRILMKIGLWQADDHCPLVQNLPPASLSSAVSDFHLNAEFLLGLQGFWKGVLPSLVMVCNPTVQYVLFEWLLARIREARTKAGRKGSAVAPTGFQVGFEPHLHMSRLNCHLSRRQTVLDFREG